MSAVDQVRDEALRLDESDRALLARDLLASLEGADLDRGAAADWAAEIRARSDAVARGQFSAADWRESIERVRQHLAQRRGS